MPSVGPRQNRLASALEDKQLPAKVSFSRMLLTCTLVSKHYFSLVKFERQG